MSNYFETLHQRYMDGDCLSDMELMDLIDQVKRTRADLVRLNFREYSLVTTDLYRTLQTLEGYWVARQEEK